jgi:hypothetical protein
VRRLEVGLLDSVAWRADGEVHLSMHLPDAPLAAGAEGVVLRLRDGERRVRAAVTVGRAETGVQVGVAVPARRLTDGLWRLTLLTGPDEEPWRVEARLLVRPGQPIALLPGPEPATKLPEPEPGHPAGGDRRLLSRQLPGRVAGRLRRDLARGRDRLRRAT